MCRYITIDLIIIWTVYVKPLMCHVFLQAFIKVRNERKKQTSVNWKWKAFCSRRVKIKSGEIVVRFLRWMKIVNMCGFLICKEEVDELMDDKDVLWFSMSKQMSLKIIFFRVEKGKGNFKFIFFCYKYMKSLLFCD